MTWNAKPIAALASMALFLACVITFSLVVLRYIFNVGSVAVQDLVIYLHVLAITLGIPYALFVGAHVKIDVFYRNFSSRKKMWVQRLGNFILLMPMSVYLFFMTWPFVVRSWRVLEGSPEAGGMPGLFLIKTLLLLLPLWLFLVALYWCIPRRRT